MKSSFQRPPGDSRSLRFAQSKLYLFRIVFRFAKLNVNYSLPSGDRREHSFSTKCWKEVEEGRLKGMNLNYYRVELRRVYRKTVT